MFFSWESLIMPLFHVIASMIFCELTFEDGDRLDITQGYNDDKRNLAHLIMQLWWITSVSQNISV